MHISYSKYINMTIYYDKYGDICIHELNQAYKLGSRAYVEPSRAFTSSTYLIIEPRLNFKLRSFIK
jgi:hypothetical protein